MKERPREAKKSTDKDIAAQYWEKQKEKKYLGSKKWINFPLSISPLFKWMHGPYNAWI
jgi:hypothetical protein